MSWHYLPGLVAGSSEESSAGSAPSAPWKSNRTAGKCSSDASATACFPCSRSGTTPEPSTGDPGVDSWMSSLRASRVSPSALPAGGNGNGTTGTCGPIPFASFGKYDQLSRSWKTFPDFFPATISAKSSGGFGRAGMTRGGIAYRRPESEPPIGVTGSGFWPTPNVPNGGRSPKGGIGPTGIMPDGKKRQVGLESAIKLWPTPRAADGSHGGRVTPRKSKEGGNPIEAVAARSWPTPSARDWRTGKNESCWENSRPLSEVVGGLLNPRWVEWLMGMPIGWTSFEPLETARFQSAWLAPFLNYLRTFRST